MSDDRHKPRAPRRVEFEDAVANLLSLGTLAGVWYYGNKYPYLARHWLFAAGISLGLLTYTLLIGPLRKLLTTLKYVILIGMLLSAVAYIIWKIAHQNA